MRDEFEIKDLENLKYFLGMEVTTSKEGIFVSQRKYTLDLLKETCMIGCRPVDISIVLNAKLGILLIKFQLTKKNISPW